MAAKLPQDVVIAAFTKYLCGDTMSAIARALKITQPTVVRWRDNGDWKSRREAVNQQALLDAEQAMVSELAAVRKETADRHMEVSSDLIAALHEKIIDTKTGKQRNVQSEELADIARALKAATAVQSDAIGLKKRFETLDPNAPKGMMLVGVVQPEVTPVSDGQIIDVDPLPDPPAIAPF